MINYEEIDKASDVLNPAIEDVEMEEVITEAGQATTHKKDKNTLIRFPLAKIKNIMKLDEENKLCQKNAYYVIGRMTELFLQELAKTSHSVAKMNKRKTMNLEDIACAVKSIDKFSFIDIESIFNVETLEALRKKEEKGPSTIKKPIEKEKTPKKKQNKAAESNYKIDQMFIKK